MNSYIRYSYSYKLSNVIISKGNKSINEIIPKIITFFNKNRIGLTTKYFLSKEIIINVRK